MRADSKIASVKSHGKSVVRVKTGAVAPVLVVVTPATATVPAGGSQTFAAAVTGTTNLSVTWTVQEGSSCGSVSAAGLYTAPNAGATCHVVATSAADATKSGSATVTVTPPPRHRRERDTGHRLRPDGRHRPPSAPPSPGRPAGESTAVTWSVPAGAGTIGASTGVYVAPATPGTYVVTATSVADAVRNRDGHGHRDRPGPGRRHLDQPDDGDARRLRAQIFTATVTSTSNTAVTWSVTEAGGGSVVTGTYMAPQTAGTYHVVATSLADATKTAIGDHHRGPEKVLSVAVNPGSGTVQANGTLAFAAMVTTTCGTFAAQ